jgi:hypothetical protein
VLFIRSASRASIGETVQLKRAVPAAEGAVDAGAAREFARATDVPVGDRRLAGTGRGAAVEGIDLAGLLEPSDVDG